ncbi:MAG: succinate dehydrogenase cytochrome b subunit [Deltaproteobacteria bacterium]|nr:succinate dehydrogenase cytochrome b subunit [Deltaproteobacteria bacterium]
MIGRKAIMAISGVVLFGYVVGHLLGNLQVFLGRERINAYAAFLHATPSLLWGTRAILLASVVFHVMSAVQLARLSSAARPVGYHARGTIQASWSSRTMLWSGAAIALFVVYHLLHQTVGTAHPDFRPGDVYSNLVVGFRQVPSSIAYIAALVLLGMHLRHGGWAMVFSLGFARGGSFRGWRRFVFAFTVVLILGYISIPLAVMAGLVG